MKTTEYTAILDAPDLAGAITLWHLHSTVDSSALAAAWEAADLPEELLTIRVSERAALTYAVKRAASRDHIIEQTRTGYAVLVKQHLADDRIGTEQVAHFKLGDQRTSVKIAGAREVVRKVACDTDDTRLAEEVERLYTWRLATWTTQDMSLLLVQLVKHLAGISIRDGVYFIQPTRLPMWETIAGVVESVSHHCIYKVPAMNSDQTVRVCLDSVVRKAEAEIAALEDALDDDKLGKRALRTKADAAERINEEIGGYVDFLGNDVLDKLRDQFSTLQSRLMAASLATSGDDND